MVIRIQKRQYAVVPLDAAQDENLGPEALGLLTYLFSLPPDQRIRKTELYQRFANSSKGSIDTALKQLAEAGYLDLQST